MKIAKATLKNFKRIAHVEIEPSTSTIVISGCNGQGKSSVLDGFSAALGGERLCPPLPIREGERSAEVSVHLDDGLHIVRTWTRSKGGTSSKLNVTSPEGEVIASPQAVLDKLKGPLNYEPENFLRGDAKLRLSLVKQACNIETADLDAAEKAAFDERTEANRELKRADAVLLEIGFPPPAGKRIEVAELLKEQTEIIRAQNVRKAALDDVAKLEVELDRASAAEKKAASELEAAIAERERVDRALVRAKDAFKAAPHPPPLEEVSKRIQASQAHNDAVSKAEAQIRHRDIAQQTRNELADEVQLLTDKIETTREEREKRVASAKFPIPGLGFGLDGVTYKGVPLEQASSAEQLRVSLAIGIALNPVLRVILIRSGSLLDEDSLKLVEEFAEANDAQVFLEVVGKGKGGVVIHDGKVEEEDR
jgi:DNA repair exonuclease SbcCD ATPase subunit